MDIRPPLPLRVVLKTGELRCPMKQGILALESCMALHQERGARCFDLRCHHVAHQGDFIVELKRARGENVPKVKIPRTPGKRTRVWPAAS